MADFLTTYFLFFSATDDGTTLTPTSSYGGFPLDEFVFDTNNDDNIDSVDYYQDSTFPYSGYTISINGNEYALFVDNIGYYYIPYDQNFENISLLQFQPVTQTITKTGDDAVVANCYLTGTLIATPEGERAIETLQPGDFVALSGGGTSAVRWVARQEIAAEAVNLSLPEDRLPIRIEAGALGPGVPHTDLTVSAGHGMVLDGMIVNASALVNGAGIRFLRADEMPRRFTYWHVELDQHSVLLANGAPSESYVDYTARQTYDNYADYIELHGADRLIPEMALPRLSARRLVPPALRARLNGAMPSEREAS